MNEVVLETRGVTKRYGKQTAVNDVSMTIRQGDIYGLIGKNGAGKTTLIRLITSLTQADEGSIELFGSAENLNEERKRIGSIIETPAFYPNLTAVQNLEYYRILKGIPDKNVIGEVLHTANLLGTGKKKFKNFSLGMKQRLGIALALLNSPDFIILDEPINGLDPAGIVEVRETLRMLNQERGITILISSHMLAELSLTATRYGIINKGSLVKEITSEELITQCQNCIAVTVDDPAKAAGIIETELNTKNFKQASGNEIRIYDHLGNPSEVAQKLVMGGVRLSALSEIGDSLEDYFMSITGEGEKNA